MKKPVTKAPAHIVNNDEDDDDDDGDDDEELVPLHTTDGIMHDVEGSDGEGEADKEGGEEIVDVDFEFVDPKQIHYHSIKRLLSKYLPGSSVELPDLASLIIDQVTIG